ncbi:ALF repeat-containing protein, partial [Streptomyces sp. NPDC127117]|uniref:ALF repeat-containing protein n=1 Tax=Streptomyces sp. NPDC127117 TaxID=3345368 RepID=UPI00363517C2
MRPTRAALAVAAGALAPALLLSTPSFAATAPSPPVAASVAQNATADEESPYDSMSEEELRIAVLRILADPNIGKGVNREAQKALDGTVDDLRNFLKTGLRLAQAEDDRVAILRIVADPKTGKGVYREAQRALDGTPEDLRYFLETGLRLAQAEDDRVAILRIVADPKTGKGVYRE